MERSLRKKRTSNNLLNLNDMMHEEEQHYKDIIQGYRAKLDEARQTIDSNIPTVQKAEEVLAFHLEQLKKRGATLEDSVAEILRGVLEQAKAKEEIPSLRKAIEENQGELDNIRGL